MGTQSHLPSPYDDPQRVLAMQVLYQMAAANAARCEVDGDSEHCRRYELLAAKIRERLESHGIATGGGLIND